MGYLRNFSTKLLHNLSRHSKFSTRNIFLTSRQLNQEPMEKLEKNPYFEKYAERIAELQRTSPEEFLKRVEAVQPKSAPRAAAAPPGPGPGPGPVDTRQYSSVLNPKAALKDTVPIEDRKLDAIFKVDLVKDKDASEIQSIWEQYHLSKEVICGTIPVALYAELRDHMKRYPTFLFPLPRAQGYEFIMCQSHGHSVHFTPLLAFQVHKENAPECLTMTHYTELQDKGIVLMRGEYDKNVLTGQEAQCLANQFQMYYNGKDPNKWKLVEAFTDAPDAFQHMDLISQMENITLV